MSFKLYNLPVYNKSLDELPSGKLLINTINAHSYNMAQSDTYFAEALLHSNVLLPDGISIVFAKRFLQNIRLRKIAGSDLFDFEMNRLNKEGGTCMFVGSNEETLKHIFERALIDFPRVIVCTYAPPYKIEFSAEDDYQMISAINAFKPDVLFIGISAPKQEKWAYKYFNKLEAGHICCVGAVFDFYSGNRKRASKSMIRLGFEWLYRFIQEPGRLWKRYFFGNVRFVQLVIMEKKIRKKNK